MELQIVPTSPERETNQRFNNKEIAEFDQIFSEAALSAAPPCTAPTIVCKIEHDFFCYKTCEILDFYISSQHNEMEIMQLLNDWLKEICRQFLCKKIIFESLTKNKFEHKIFLAEKFILEKFKFIKEI